MSHVNNIEHVQSIKNDGKRNGQFRRYYSPENIPAPSSTDDCALTKISLQTNEHSS